MVRGGDGVLVPASWEEAVARAADGLRKADATTASIPPYEAGEH
jgi:hypothetical protein